ncbi:Protein-tyrosine phosphatase mitochondrial 1 [Anas platyrhynchos]|uniref:Protein-tyrosine phosphatase mitochondrial 1 n=1 Tax=Anas platyrhynchos TaxID=8839 RepID=R0JWE9_ANAPL|nr:Protein-tyrosine phosphatase mitochondrial 1 [Anas platyrhynchos]
MATLERHNTRKLQHQKKKCSLTTSGGRECLCLGGERVWTAIPQEFTGAKAPRFTEWQALGVEQLRLSTVDLSGAPSLEQLQRGVEFLLRHREQGNSVYVHCKAGRSRSATMVAAYLIQVRRVLVVRARMASFYSLVWLKSPELHHWTPQEAIEAIAKIRPHILIRRKQVQVLEAFHRNMIAGTTAEGQ